MQQSDFPKQSAEFAEAKLLSKAAVLEITGRTFPTIWSWMRAGKFPSARDLNGRPVWIRSEIDRYINNLPKRAYKDVNSETVSRARKKTTAANVAVEKRTGKDGKVRKLPTEPAS